MWKKKQISHCGDKVCISNFICQFLFFSRSRFFALFCCVDMYVCFSRLSITVMHCSIFIDCCNFFFFIPMGPCSFSVRHHQYCIILPLTTTVVEVCVFEVKKKWQGSNKRKKNACDTWQTKGTYRYLRTRHRGEPNMWFRLLVQIPSPSLCLGGFSVRRGRTCLFRGLLTPNTHINTHTRKL